MISRHRPSSHSGSWRRSLNALLGAAELRTLDLPHTLFLLAFLPLSGRSSRAQTVLPPARAGSLEEHLGKAKPSMVAATDGGWSLSGAQDDSPNFHRRAASRYIAKR